MLQILIVGVGNILLKDEGIGVHAAYALAKLKLPERIRIIDAGTSGLGLIDLMKEASSMILLDAVEMGKKPGTVIRFSPEEVTVIADKVNLSLHEIGLPQLLRLASILGVLPELVIIGIQPKEIGWGLGLSADLKKVIPNIVESVLREIDKYL